MLLARWRAVRWAALGLVWLLCALPAAASAPGADVEDPRRLETLAEAALAAGDGDRARALFEQMLQRQEVGRYMSFGQDLGDALVLERLGDVEPAAERYRQAFQTDVMRAILVLRILSVHPEREALVAEAYDHIRQLVQAVERGEQARIYVTTTGAPRYLTRITQEQLLKAPRAQYCYIPELDFSAVDEVPQQILLDRCVIGRIQIPGKHIERFAFRGVVLGDADFGKTWEGERNKSRSFPPSTFTDLVLREAIFTGRANFSDVTVTEGRAYFPMAVFEGEADFKGAEFFGDTEFRFASFGAGANFKNLRMHAPVYFGGTRYRADTVFTGLYSERDVHFNSATFEGAVSFDNCEFKRGATFEDSQFHGPATLASSQITMNLNLSRAVFEGPVNIKEVEVGALDALGTHFQQPAWFMDAHIRGRARFSLDEVTRHAMAEDLDALLPLYRHYQGDEDADAPLTTRSSYGVERLDDLNSRIDADISFANTVFGGYTVFEGVTFGKEGERSVASFFNAQFLGETHFERTTWHSLADFTTIFGTEVAFNEARFLRSLVLDDANVSGRLTLTGAELIGDADLSLYGTELRAFQIEPGQIRQEDGYHKLFYERCAFGDYDRDDVRIKRITRGQELDDASIRQICYDYVIDEFIALKDSYGDRAMTQAEDDAYWWSRHHQAMADFLYADTAFTKLWTAVVSLFLFEICFGWGVRLGNLGIAVVVVTVLFAVLYRVLCPDTVLVYDGDDVPIKDVPFLGLCYISLQSLIAVNTGWDFGRDDHTFRFLNTLETLVGFIILTFFVGAYTRMILA